jgi:hypothetical protein
VADDRRLLRQRGDLLGDVVGDRSDRLARDGAGFARASATVSASPGQLARTGA